MCCVYRVLPCGRDVSVCFWLICVWSVVNVVLLVIIIDAAHGVRTDVVGDVLRLYVRIVAWCLLRYETWWRITDCVHIGCSVMWIVICYNWLRHVGIGSVLYLWV